MKKIFILLLIFNLNFNLVNSIEPDVFVQSTVNRASLVLSKSISKEQKIIELKSIAKDTVDIRGVGFYSLGSARKKINENYTIVSSLLVGTSQRPEVKIDWRVYTKNPNNPLIRDLIIEGLSLARTQKEEFASILNSNDGNIQSLFKVLREFSKN